MHIWHDSIEDNEASHKILDQRLTRSCIAYALAQVATTRCHGWTVGRRVDISGEV